MAGDDLQLWPLVIERLRQSYLTMEPWGRGKQATRWVMLELYLLGERPTPAEVRANASSDLREVAQARFYASLWAERLRKPTRGIKGRAVPWVYPFVLPNEAVAKNGLESIADRLGTQLASAARGYADGIAADLDNAELRRLEDDVRLQQLALRVWGQTTLARRESDEIWGHVRLPKWRRLVGYRPIPPTATS